MDRASLGNLGQMSFFRKVSIAKSYRLGEGLPPARRSNCGGHRWSHSRACRGGGAISDRQVAAPGSLTVSRTSRWRAFFQSKRAFVPTVADLQHTIKELSRARPFLMALASDRVCAELQRLYLLLTRGSMRKLERSMISILVSLLTGLSHWLCSSRRAQSCRRQLPLRKGLEVRAQV
jgi:hypothetical protein